ncbi:hypothetical protein V8E36_004960 [Tilletia maclaganii]
MIDDPRSHHINPHPSSFGQMTANEALNAGHGAQAEREQPQQAKSDAAEGIPAKAVKGQDASLRRSNPKAHKSVSIADTSHSLNNLAQNAAYFDIQRALSRPSSLATRTVERAAVAPSTSVATSSSNPRSRIKIGGNGGARELTALAHKSVTALDPSMKRAFCRGCGTTLIPGLTSSVRIRPSGPHQRTVKTTCTGCQGRTKMACPPVQPDTQHSSGLARARRLRKRQSRSGTQDQDDASFLKGAEG